MLHDGLRKTLNNRKDIPTFSAGFCMHSLMHNAHAGHAVTLSDSNVTVLESANGRKKKSSET